MTMYDIETRTYKFPYTVTFEHECGQSATIRNVYADSVKEAIDIAQEQFAHRSNWKCIGVEKQ